jgi:hypothetical protein
MCAFAVRATARRVAKPKDDPRFVAVTDQVKAGATRLKKHAPPAQKAREASKSAKAPPNERLAGAQAKVVDEVRQAPTPKPQPQSFKAQLRAEIDKAMPKTLGDTEHFLESDSAGAMKGSLAGGVAKQKGDATGPVDTAAKKPPNPAAVPAQPSSALPAEPAPHKPGVDGAGAMPPPASAAEVSLDQSKKDTAQALADEKIKPQTLQKANDTRFSALAGAQAQVAAQADSAPAGFRAKETAVLAGARSQAGAVAKRGTLLLSGTRGAGNARVLTRQQQQAAREQAERKKVATDIEAIFAGTKAKVEKNLSTLDTDVAALFDPGIDGALAAMKTYVDDKIFKYKLDRYLSIPLVGLARWLADQVRGLPAEVNVFYTEGRQVFQAAMDRLIDRVASLVESRLAQAKADVATGQQQIKTYVAGLPVSLKAAGNAAEQAVADRFSELSTSIDDKKDELASALASKYKEAFDKADEALKQIQDENKGLVQKFVEKLAEVIKALMEFKAKLLAIIKKGQDAIGLILDDPIGFLGNMIAVVKGGFNAFMAHFPAHLEAGFIEWLFGSLAGAGIKLPADLTLPSILTLALDVLGITYDNMRAKAVKLVGERAVSVIEKVVEYVKVLIEGGPAKLWELVKEDLSDLKAMVIGAIKDWLITTVVKQAVLKVVSLFNPVGAIIQAILAIYNVVMFVIEKAQQILALIEAVVDSIAAIASGAIDTAIGSVEKALAKTIPLVIDFLARLIGLSGLTDKIKSFIHKVRSKVDKAIDKAIAKVVGVVKKLFGAAKAGVAKLLNWWKKKLPISGDDEPHTLMFSGEKASATLVIHSKAPLKPQLFIRAVGENKKFAKAKIDPEVEATEQLEGPIEAARGRLAKYDAAPGKGTDLAAAGGDADTANAEMEKLDKALTALRDNVAATLTKWAVAEIPLPENAEGDNPKKGEFRWARPGWSAGQKAAVAAQTEATAGRLDEAAGKTLLKMFLPKGAKGQYVAPGVARRHVVSSGDIATHYRTVLASKPKEPLYPSSAKLLLEQRTSISEAMTPVSGTLPKQADIVAAAKARHRKFFGYAKNIFLGGSPENSALQEKLDKNHPELDEKKLAEHIDLIKRAWALSKDFKPTRD